MLWFGLLDVFLASFKATSIERYRDYLETFRMKLRS